MSEVAAAAAAAAFVAYLIWQRLDETNRKLDQILKELQRRPWPQPLEATNQRLDQILKELQRK